MKKILAALALAIGLTGVSLLNVTPALAAHVGPAGYVTFYDGCTGGSSSNHTVGYCGAAWPIPQSQLGQGVCHNVPTGSNDRFSAFDNNTAATSWYTPTPTAPRPAATRGCTPVR